MDGEECLAFVEAAVSPIRGESYETGPTLWPVAWPVWCTSLFPSRTPTRANQLPLLIIVAAVHGLGVLWLLMQSGMVNLGQIREQSRLTVVKVMEAMQAPEKNEPKAAPMVVEEPARSTEETSTPLEWTRVPNWRPPAGTTDGTAAAGGTGSGYDAMYLLAGLGAIGPAKENEGVVDPYAGASPIWTRAPQSSLLLINAPNPAVLEQIRRQIMLQFRHMNGYAELTVLVDRDGTIANILKITSDIPSAAQTLLKTQLVGRVISGPHSTQQTIILPRITFE